MKEKFIITKNVSNLYQLAETLLSKDTGTPGLGLFFGPPGLGKTKAAIYMYAQKEFIYLRAKTAWTIRWFLNDLLEELDEQEQGRTKAAYDRLVEIFTVKPQLVIIDEVDHMLHDAKVIETMRDIHDETGNCFLLIGMQDAERKMKGYPHLYDRFADVVKATAITREEILKASDEMCEVPMDESAAQLLFEHTNGDFRRIITWLYTLERSAKASGKEAIDRQMIKKLIKKKR